MIFGVINMKKSQVKKSFLNFVIALTICSMLGFLSHDFINGVRIGLGIGIGIAIVVYFSGRL
jgi:hypothetical protein